MVSVLVLGVATTAYSKTSTTSGVFTADTTTVTAGSIINLSILGLNAQGKVDTQGEQYGSRIVAMVTSAQGKVQALGESGLTKDEGKFEATVADEGGATRYVKLNAGVAKLSIYYPVETGGSTDNVTITLQEVIENSTTGGGGTEVNVIDSTEKVITINLADQTVKLLDIVGFTRGNADNKMGSSDSAIILDDGTVKVYDESQNAFLVAKESVGGSKIVGGGVYGGIDGAMTAGEEGGQVTVVAYRNYNIRHNLVDGKGTTNYVAAIGDAISESGLKEDASGNVVVQTDSSGNYVKDDSGKRYNVLLDDNTGELLKDGSGNIVTTESPKEDVSDLLNGVELVDVIGNPKDENGNPSTTQDETGTPSSTRSGVRSSKIYVTNSIIDGVFVLGDPQTPVVYGEEPNPAINGPIELTLRPVYGNDEPILVPGEMVKGVATFSIPSSVNKAAIYYMEAKLELGGTSISSVDLYNNDTLLVRPVDIAVKLELHSQMKTIANMSGVAGTQVHVCVLDKYGNQTKTAELKTVSLKEESGSSLFKEAAINELLTIGAKASCSISKPLDVSDMRADQTGATKLIASDTASKLTQSEPVDLKVVSQQLEAIQTPYFAAAFDAGKSIMVDSGGAFQITKKIIESTGAVAGGKTLSNATATTFTIEVINGGYEKVNAVLSKGEKLLGIRFQKATWGNEEYLISDENALYGEVVVSSDVADDIIPASPSKYEMLDGHGQALSSMEAIRKETAELPRSIVLFNENNLKLTDNYDNRVGNSDPLNLKSVNGECEQGDCSIDYRANDLGNDIYGLTYDPAKFSGEEEVSFTFKEPDLMGSNVAVLVSILPELNDILLDVESNKIPSNGVVPVRVTTWDQQEPSKPFESEEGLFLTVTAPTDVVVRVKSVDADGTEKGPIATDGKIHWSDERSRMILAVNVTGATTGTFTLTVRSGDGDITATQDFEITSTFEEFKVEPAEVTVVSGQSASVTIAGGSGSYTVASEDETVASAAINEDGTTVTVTAAEVEEAANTTVTITDDDSSKTVTIAVSVIAPANEEECQAEGNVYDDGNCQQLPDTGGEGGEGSTAVDANGNLTTSAAEFSGGWTNTGTYATSVEISKDGGNVDAVQVIRFDPAHVGQEVDIILILAVQLQPTFGSIYWWYVVDTTGIVGPTLTLDIAGIEALETHTVVADEPKVMGLYKFEDLALGIVADFMSYFGYRTSDGTVIFSGEPITLKVR
ncbi:MAG: hypothetical protein DRQ41_07295 [Gammaproteobacteria bacterium]|nr:MAG: hypothetical protein DRQ41_07295 [Gammaproteobacteria bacterium]